MSAPTDSPDAASVERFIPAPAAAIFDLLADPARHRDIDGSGTVQGPPAGSQRLVLGSTFGMDMKAGFGYTMVNTVVEFETDRRIAWQPRPDKAFLRPFVGGRIWRYELEPSDDGGTVVTETFDWSTSKSTQYVELMGWPKRNEANVNATLDRLVAYFEHRADL